MKKTPSHPIDAGNIRVEMDFDALRQRQKPIAGVSDFAEDGLLRARALNKIISKCPYYTNIEKERVCSLLNHTFENGYAMRQHCSKCQKDMIGV